MSSNSFINSVRENATETVLLPHGHTHISIDILEGLANSKYDKSFCSVHRNTSLIHASATLKSITNTSKERYGKISQHSVFPLESQQALSLFAPEGLEADLVDISATDVLLAVQKGLL